MLCLWQHDGDLAQEGVVVGIGSGIQGVVGVRGLTRPTAVDQCSGGPSREVGDGLGDGSFYEGVLGGCGGVRRSDDGGVAQAI